MNMVIDATIAMDIVMVLNDFLLLDKKSITKRDERSRQIQTDLALMVSISAMIPIELISDKIFHNLLLNSIE